MRWKRNASKYAAESRFLPARLGIAIVFLLLPMTFGCRHTIDNLQSQHRLDSLQSLANLVPDAPVATEVLAPQTEAIPFTIYDETTNYWDMTVTEAVELALQNSTVLRDSGGLVIRSADQVPTAYKPLLVESDPQVGVDAALALFDAQMSGRLVFENNDRAVNNRFLGGGANLLKQDLAKYELQLEKRGATGTTYTLRHSVDYDGNNLPSNLFPRSYTTWVEGEVRHPLMQGSGVGFNRIAGPAATPGRIQGVVIARMNTDISQIELEQSVRDMVNSVENAYWDLYFAYRMLQTRQAARDQTLEVLKQIESKAGLASGIAEQQALAKAQFYAFDIEVKNSLAGRLVEGTRANNGSPGGTFRGSLGIQMAERRLRFLMGIPLSDGRLIRPAHDPVLVRTILDWNECVEEAQRRRTEIRRQEVQVNKRHLEYVANKNFLLPQLDFIGRYRFRGFGEELLSSDRRPGRDVPSLDEPRFDNAFQDLTTGDFQEWLLGLEFRAPVGRRAGFNAVRNARLQWERDKRVLDEARRLVTHDLSMAIADLHRSYEVCQSTQLRRLAVRTRLELLVERNRRTGRVEPSVLLDVFRQAADADAEYFRSLVDHTIAIKNVHLEKGSLLDYAKISLVQS